MRLFDYVAREGFWATVAKSARKISAMLGGKGSETIFLFREVRDFPKFHVPLEYELREITESDFDKFIQFNFFPHIEVRDYVPAGKNGAFGCFKKGKLVAYVCYEGEKNKTIHSTGSFHLLKGEAWVGPCYVDRAHRGKGLNKVLVKKAATSLAKKGVSRLFTSINGANASSLSSFKQMGFQEFALYSKRFGVLPIAGVSRTAVGDLTLNERILVNRTKRGN